VLKPVDLLPFSGPLSAILPVCSALDNSSLVVQFFLKGAVSLPEGSASFSQGWSGRVPHVTGAHIFGLWNVSQAGL
jgi:hypothetical protein